MMQFDRPLPKENQGAGSMYAAGKNEVRRWRSCCPKGVRFQPSCSKGAVLIVVGPLVILFALLMQAGMLRLTSTRLNPWEIVVNSVNTLQQSTSRELLDEDGVSFAPTPRGSPGAECLSRIQHMRHRSAAQVIPSAPALEKALTAYEKRHAQCSESVGQNWTATFLRFRAADGEPGPQTNDHPGGCKFLVYREGGYGLGNRLIALVSAFVYALLTDRVFLIYGDLDHGNLGQLLCNPFPDSSWALPHDFPWHLIVSAPDLGQTIKNDFNSSNVRLMLEHSPSGGDKMFFCSHTRERLHNITWVSWTSNQYYIPRLFTFPEFWPQLHDLVPNPSHVFTHLSRYLLLPNNEIWEKIVRIRSSYLSSADKVIGVQIRRHSVPHTGDFSAAALDRMLYCLVARGILPNASTDPTSFPTEQMLSLMDMRSPGVRLSRRTSAGGDQQSVPLHYVPGVTSVLIASLQIKYAEELQDLYTNYPTADGSLVRIHMVSHEGSEWHSYDQAKKAFIEMWLLSLSDHLATSSWSTFGYVAQGLGALQPVIVNLRGELKEAASEDHMHDPAIPNSHCLVGQSLEPCNHYPFYPKLDCDNETAREPAHEEWLQQHYLNCQDGTDGRQLVS